jgi:hypothetical protein
MTYDTVSRDPRASLPAKLAIAAAIVSIVASVTGHPIWGIVAGLLGVLLSAMGFLSAASPKVRGGMLSVSALVLSVIGLGLAVLVSIGVILF